jgi:O-antigen/teichoic acid export membrane protein
LAVGALGSLLSARFLDPREFAFFVLVVSIAAWSAPFFSLGLISSTAVLVGEHPKRAAHLRWVIVRLSFVIAVALVGGIVSVSIVFSPNWLRLAWVGLGILLAAQVLHASLNGIQLAQRQFVGYALLQLGRATLFLFGICTLYLVDRNTGTNTVLMAAIAFVAPALFIVIPIKQPSTKYVFALLRRAVQVGFRAMVASALGQLILRVDLLIVSAMLPGQVAGLYALANIANALLLQVASSVGTLAFPLAFGQSKGESFAEVRRMSIGLLAIATVTFPIIAIFAEPLIQIAIGERYSGAGEIFGWLLPGCAFMCAATPIANFIGARGYPWSYVISHAIALVTQVAICMVLIPGYGPIGAAVASTIGYFVLAAGLYRSFARDWRVMTTAGSITNH